MMHIYLYLYCEQQERNRLQAFLIPAELLLALDKGIDLS